ncbi:hypothetical protein C8R46DRAFT_1290740 [Mycena filopes]|nr:hypothetical protein C8R46DRAFT_1290740 [Mycena filopes]
MFSKPQLAIFALSLVSVSLGRPLDSPTKRVGEPIVVRAQVVRAQVVARDTPACSSCTLTGTQTTLTFTVSGSATATAAFTVTAGNPISTASPSAIGDFGSCSTPQVEFGAGFDGRTETSFRPVDQASYNHASADTIGVIADFICNALVDTCHADSTAQATCAKAQAQAATQPPQEGIAADTFNAVFGIQTDFKDVTAISDTGSTTSASGGSNTSAEAHPHPTTSLPTLSTVAFASAPTGSNSTTALGATGTTTTAATSPGTATISSTSAAAAPAGTTTSGNGNLQTFTGSLGGITAPAVVVAAASGSGNQLKSTSGSAGGEFQVVGNSVFKDAGDALARSCSIQKNDCADAANASGNKGSFTVSACGTQESACIAASGAKS